MQSTNSGPMPRERLTAGNKKSGPHRDLRRTGQWACWGSVAAWKIGPWAGENGAQGGDTGDPPLLGFLGAQDWLCQNRED